MVYIYKITSPTNKVYIGKTKDIERRNKEYERCAHVRNSVRGQIKIFNSIVKYGWNNHKSEIIGKYHKSEANQAEIYWISHYNTYNSKDGLNLTLGGDGGSGIKGRIVSKETRDKLAVSRSKHRVYCFIDGVFDKEFVSSRAAGIHYGISTATILGNVKNKTICMGKYIFSKTKNITIDDYVNSVGKKVVKLSSDGEYICEYDTILEAATDNGISIPSGISRCAKGITSMCAGFRWVYKDEYDTGHRGRGFKCKKAGHFKVNKISKSTKKVIRTYNSVREAAIDNGKSVRNIYDYFHKGYIGGDFVYELVR